MDRADHGGPWASVDYEPGAADFEVQQAGNRSLWDEVCDAYVQWLGWGRPDVTRFGTTVTPDRSHTVWLDNPEHVI